MKTTSEITLVRLLHYVFLALSIAAAVLLLLELISYFGITSGYYHIRGWITTVGDPNPVVVPYSEGSGALKLFEMGQKRFVMLEFADMQHLMQLQNLAYLFFQNLAWVLGILVLYQMMRIFRNLDRGITFRLDNIRRVRWIALLALSFPAARFIAARLLAGITNAAGGGQISMAGPAVRLEDIVFGGLIAMIIFALGEIFRRGEHLQQEQDLTI